ncbi:MAG: hypothetical protein ACRDZ5_05590, partial [Acidimicrobiales bacterium]
AAGEIAEEDYERLHHEYATRALGLGAALDAPAGTQREVHPVQGDTTTPRPPRGGGLDTGSEGPGIGRFASWCRARRRHLVVAACACFAAALAVLGLAFGSVAPFSSSGASGLSLSQRIDTELGEATVLAKEHNVVEAVAVYDKVLALDPHQPEALAEAGWLVRLAGLSTHRSDLVTGGDEEIAAAVRYAPRYAVPRAYYAAALLEDRHDAAAAVRQLDAMLEDRPQKTLVSSVRQVAVAAYEKTGATLPAAFGA